MTHPSCSTTVTVRAQARDEEVGLTLREMASLVQDAMRADIDLDTPVLVRIGWHHQIRRAAIGGRP